MSRRELGALRGEATAAASLISSRSQEAPRTEETRGDGTEVPLLVDYPCTLKKVVTWVWVGSTRVLPPPPPRDLFFFFFEKNRGSDHRLHERVPLPPGGEGPSSTPRLAGAERRGRPWEGGGGARGVWGGGPVPGPVTSVSVQTSPALCVPTPATLRRPRRICGRSKVTA